jgi:transcriptional regulator with XRE-family HTH domain
MQLRGVGDYIREQRRVAQVSLRQLAKVAGVSNPYLSQIERGLRKPSAEILQQIAKGLRISAEQLYIQAGILDERPGDTEIVAAILADAALTERQKQVLLEIYDSFRKENMARAAAEAAASPAEESAGESAEAPGEPVPAAADEIDDIQTGDIQGGAEPRSA